MAKLGVYYGLCPLIDQRNLLGVSEDSESAHVIVTLGKNIAIKYRLSDQKQIHSWRTKDKFSSPVIYDSETSRYVAVFNQVYMRTWQGDEEYVDKLKKYKFNTPIHTLTKCAGKSFVVFKNGSVVPLNFALENRKTLELEDMFPEASIIEIRTAVLKTDIYVGVLLQSTQSTYFGWSIFSEDKKQKHKVELARENADLMGHVVSQTDNQHSMHLLTLWSDGKLYSYPLAVQSDAEPTQVIPPGHVFAVVESLSCKHPVTMISLNHHYIAMYGAAPNQEGAILMLYNSQFKVSQTKQPHKLFTSGTKLWHVEDNLLLTVGQNLAVIPFHLDTEQLAALVGSHRAALLDLDSDISIVEELEVVSWAPSTPTETTTKPIPIRIKPKVVEYSNQGLSEATICEELIPEYLETKDVQSISSCLEYFYDLPEACLAKLLRFCLTADGKLFRSVSAGEPSLIPPALQPLERCLLIDKVMACSFSDIQLLQCVRTELDLNSTLLLLQYICYLMSEDGHCLPSLGITDSESKLVEWGCLLLDANYQKFLFSKDPKVLDMLTCYSQLVYKYLTCLDNLGQTVPLLRELKKGKELHKNKEMAGLKYSIEQLSLY